MDKAIKYHKEKLQELLDSLEPAEMERYKEWLYDPCWDLELDIALPLGGVQRHQEIIWGIEVAKEEVEAFRGLKAALQLLGVTK